MGVKANYTATSLNAYFDAVQQIIKEEMIQSLSLLGEESISRIRDRSREESWIDRTGNLRTSIGYSVVDHGRKEIESAFQQVLNGTEGAAKGRELIDSLVKKYSDTYALIVVAGMDYAERVEAIDSKDVLASTELWAKSVIDERLRRTVAKIERRIKKLSL